MNYKEALKYLEGFQRFGIRLGLRNIRRLLKLLGNPQERLRVIHIGGTNGKGSVGAFLFYILKEAGYNVGLYTSPHLIDFRERIRTIQGLISKRELARLTQVISNKLQVTSNNLKEKIKGKNQDRGSRIQDPDFQPTFFEITTAIALKYFADQRVDFTILEVGMGGRLDATNITRPLVSVITNVDFEHTEYLGKSLRKIAYEKCGIIKEGIPVVTAEKKREASRVIEDTCRERKARLYRIGKEIRIDPRSLILDPCLIQHPASSPRPSRWAGQGIQHLRNQEFNYQGIYDRYENLKISLLGRHQLLNAACAIGAIDLLQPQTSITKEQIKKGLAKTTWPGRLEIKPLTVNRSPFTVILDGAHNVAGAEALREAIRSSFNYRRLILVLGILKDKDIKGILAQLAPLASRIIITRPQTPRAAEPEEIVEIAKKYSDSIVIKEKVSQATKQAISYAKSKDIILITGSIYTIGEAKTYLER
ncbi:bifunctional folylpolyglutamate synthase/dihydrofolate synthase [bacterium]|nr:bifunctional folylpolyglutamate synthase/dihydrofolate synthase [bacterium]